MPVLDMQRVSAVMQEPSRVRNVCILAHVDHGKTTLADLLVAAGGIIPARAAGRLRYLDSRPDEQARGITLKSSSIALMHQHEGRDYLVNLVDSPGHVDFSGEVSTAVRLCDGAIILVDAVEGVCPQTRVALKQAYEENIKPVLVVNKLDRLALEMRLSALDAHAHLAQLLDQVNAVLAELFTTKVFQQEDAKDLQQSQVPYNWTSALEDADDSQLYFAPEAGNVVFACATDGWGFTTDTFAEIFSKKLGMNVDTLKKVIWGDFYLDAKSKKFMKGAREKAKKPVFVQLVLENIWAVYETIGVRKERTKAEEMSRKLVGEPSPALLRELKQREPQALLRAVLSPWLPAAPALLRAVIQHLPSPIHLALERAKNLLRAPDGTFTSLPPAAAELQHDFVSCDASNDKPVIIFISKMFPVDKRVLPRNKIKPLTPEEMALRRAAARKKREEKENEANNQEQDKCEQVPSESEAVEVKAEDEEGDVLIGFARIFSGTVRRGTRLYVLGPKHDPAVFCGPDPPQIPEDLKLEDLQSNQHVTTIVIEELYMLMGRELEEIDEVPAGNIFGIGGLSEHVLKTATLSSTPICPAFAEMQMLSVPIVRVAVEPQVPSDLGALLKGLRLLNRADACAQVLLQETGEHVLLTAGEVHLERCLQDLRERYAKVAISVSEPIVPFRETIVAPPKMDMVNEEMEPAASSPAENITLQTPDKRCTIQLRAVPLPAETTQLLQRSSRVLLLWTDGDLKKPTEEMLNFKKELEGTFDDDGSEWERIIDRIWSAGPRKNGPNLLIGAVGMDLNMSLFRDKMEESVDTRMELMSGFLNGFQLASLAGPLCEEPMMGVAFIVEEWSLLAAEVNSGLPYGPLSGQVMSAVKEGCRRAFQAQPQRLMVAMYSCQVSAKAQVLGACYSVLRRRHGRLLQEQVDRLGGAFLVEATLPVQEARGLADELRTQTSGLAALQLLFSHYETLELDPFWAPSTQQEYLHFGEKADTENRARRYMDSVRTRKGLHVHSKLVAHAEKQRTLSKNK